MFFAKDVAPLPSHEYKLCKKILGFVDDIRELGKNATLPTCFFSQQKMAACRGACLKTLKPGWWDVGAVGGTGGMDGETPVVALIGGSSSANTIPVASITAVLKVPQAGHIRYVMV